MDATGSLHSVAIPSLHHCFDCSTSSTPALHQFHPHLHNYFHDISQNIIDLPVPGSHYPSPSPSILRALVHYLVSPTTFESGMTISESPLILTYTPKSPTNITLTSSRVLTTCDILRFVSDLTVLRGDSIIWDQPSSSSHGPIDYPELLPESSETQLISEATLTTTLTAAIDAAQREVFLDYIVDHYSPAIAASPKVLLHLCAPFDDACTFLEHIQSTSSTATEILQRIASRLHELNSPPRADSQPCEKMPVDLVTHHHGLSAPSITTRMCVERGIAWRGMLGILMGATAYARRVAGPATTELTELVWKVQVGDGGPMRDVREWQDGERLMAALTAVAAKGLGITVWQVSECPLRS